MSSPLPPYLSPSSISTFEQCPLKYKYTRIDKLPEPPTEATLMGNFVHEVLENFYALPSDSRTIHEVKQISAFVWAESGWLERVEPIIANSVQVKSGKSTLDKEINAFRWKSWFCIENIFTVENPLFVEPAGIETELNGHIEGVPIKGFIDRWSRSDSGLVISDYKTGKSPKPGWEEKALFQLRVYALLYWQNEGVLPRLLQLIYLGDSKIVKSEPNEEQLKSTEKILKNIGAEILTAIEQNDFPTKKSRLCDWCFFKAICPAHN
jgi:putative RecB family exonuclease